MALIPIYPYFLNVLNSQVDDFLGAKEGVKGAQLCTNFKDVLDSNELATFVQTEMKKAATRNRDKLLPILHKAKDDSDSTTVNWQPLVVIFSGMKAHRAYKTSKKSLAELPEAYRSTLLGQLQDPGFWGLEKTGILFHPTAYANPKMGTAWAVERRTPAEIKRQEKAATNKAEREEKKKQKAAEKKAASEAAAKKPGTTGGRKRAEKNSQGSTAALKKNSSKKPRGSGKK